MSTPSVGADRADLLERLSYECYLTSEPAEALEARREAVALHESAGDTRRLGVGQRWLSRLSWFLGLNADAESYAVAAVATLEPLGCSADLAMAYSNVSHLRMMAGTPEEALAWGRRAYDAAREAGDREVEAHALNNMGTALLRRGDWVEGRARVDQSLDIALADGLEEHAARAWISIGALQAAKRMLADAEQTFRTGVAYCTARDLDTSSLYMQGWLAGVLLEQGRTDAAVGMAEGVLEHPHLSVVSRIPALLATGLAAVRRGDPEVGGSTGRGARAGPVHRGATTAAAGGPATGRGSVDRRADRRHRCPHRRRVGGLRRGLGAMGGR